MRCALVLFNGSVWKTFLDNRFRERRVRPLCHLMVRQQTWRKIIQLVVAAGLQMWESRMRFPSLASARRHLQPSRTDQHRGSIRLILSEHRPRQPRQLIENNLQLEAEYICADCASPNNLPCSPAADHTFWETSDLLTDRGASSPRFSDKIGHSCQLYKG
jgi:hypothetical protein